LQKRISYLDKQQINTKTEKNAVNNNFQHQQQYRRANFSVLSDILQDLKNLTTDMSRVRLFVICQKNVFDA